MLDGEQWSSDATILEDGVNASFWKQTLEIAGFKIVNSQNLPFYARKSPSPGEIGICCRAPEMPVECLQSGRRKNATLTSYSRNLTLPKIVQIQFFSFLYKGWLFVPNRLSLIFLYECFLFSVYSTLLNKTSSKPSRVVFTAFVSSAQSESSETASAFLSLIISTFLSTCPSETAPRGLGWTVATVSSMIEGRRFSHLFFFFFNLF